jgi:hypothetical protein
MRRSCELGVYCTLVAYIGGGSDGAADRRSALATLPDRAELGERDAVVLSAAATGLTQTLVVDLEISHGCAAT